MMARTGRQDIDQVTSGDGCGDEAIESPLDQRHKGILALLDLVSIADIQDNTASEPEDDES